MFGSYIFLNKLRKINPIPDKIEVMSYVKILESSIILRIPFSNNRIPMTINEIFIVLFIVLFLNL